MRAGLRATVWGRGRETLTTSSSTGKGLKNQVCIRMATYKYVRPMLCPSCALHSQPQSYSHPYSHPHSHPCSHPHLASLIPLLAREVLEHEALHGHSHAAPTTCVYNTTSSAKQRNSSTSCIVGLKSSRSCAQPLTHMHSAQSSSGPDPGCCALFMLKFMCTFPQSSSRQSHLCIQLHRRPCQSGTRFARPHGPTAQQAQVVHMAWCK